MNAIIYKTKKWIGSFFILRKPSSETCNYPEHVLTLRKERQIWQKSKICLLFFCKKTRDEASKVITNSLKTLDFVTSIPFDTFFWQK